MPRPHNRRDANTLPPMPQWLADAIDEQAKKNVEMDLAFSCPVCGTKAYGRIVSAHRPNCPALRNGDGK